MYNHMYNFYSKNFYGTQTFFSAFVFCIECTPLTKTQIYLSIVKTWMCRSRPILSVFMPEQRPQQTPMTIARRPQPIMIYTKMTLRAFSCTFSWDTRQIPVHINTSPTEGRRKQNKDNNCFFTFMVTCCILLQSSLSILSCD